MLFEDYVRVINRLAVQFGWAREGSNYCESYAWRQSWEDGLSPEEAWSEEVHAAAC